MKRNVFIVESGKADPKYITLEGVFACEQDAKQYCLDGQYKETENRFFELNDYWMRIRSTYLEVKMNIEIENLSADNAGELLREMFYDPKLGYGCYMNFEVRPEVEKLPNTPIPWFDFSVCCEGNDKPDLITDRVDPECGEVYQTYQLNDIKMMYHWDGDGELIFILPSGKVLANNDCKKDRYWKWFNNWSDFSYNEAL